MYEDNSDVDDLKEYQFEDDEKLSKFRKWFKGAIESWYEWRTEAKEDYDFVVGKQWTDSELVEFEKQHRPALVINRILPLVNLISGWQRSNRFDISFLPRTADDLQLAELREGVTKYVMDNCNYETAESSAFLDCAIGGLAWFYIRYKYDYETDKGNATVERGDPFSIFVDPEAHELDFSDAKFICRAKWADKDELIALYPDKAEDIEANYSLYDPAEKEYGEKIEIDPIWYSSELKKVRVIECWYREREKQTMFYTADGQKIPFTEENQMQIALMKAQNLIVDYQDIQVTVVRCCTFFDRTLLEDIESPYQHKLLPFVPMVFRYYGVGDVPAGFVRALKDPLAGTVVKTLNDLSVGDFDIVISDIESSTTQRRAQAMLITDAASKLGIPPQIITPLMLQLYDVPKRDQIIKAYQQMQEQQAQAQQQEQEMKLRIEEIKNQDSKMIITYKDSHPLIQWAMAAHAGLIPPDFANNILQKIMSQIDPQFVSQMQMQPQPQQPMPQMPQMAEVPRDPQQVENQQKPQTMTNAAAQSLVMGGMPSL